MKPFCEARQSASRLLWGALLGLVLTACQHTPAVAPTPRSVEAIADEYLAALVERYPEYGTFYGLPGARHDRLYDNSQPAREAWSAREDAWLAELEAIGAPAEVGSRDWVTWGILREALAASAAERICRSELWAASGMTAWHTQLPSLFDYQPLDNDDLKRQALDRLQAVDEFIDTETALLRTGLALGYSTPRVTAEVVPAEVRALLDPSNPFVNLAQRAGDPAFSARVEETFDAEIAPAIRRFADFIESEYLPAARTELGVTANPDGAVCYPARVRSFATIAPSAEAIHALGLKQMASIRAEMTTIASEHFPGETVESLLDRLTTDPQFTFRSSEDVLQYSLDALRAAREAMPRAFAQLPKAGVEIKPYPAYRESGTGEYLPSSQDGSRPGIFYIAVTTPERRSRAGQQSTLYHETYPGHHLQGAIALELGDQVHPLVRFLSNSGFAEGWGMYAERLADELGLYSGPVDRFGMLSDQAARAARLVIDSGIHALGWTRQQAVDYLDANTSWPDADIESEVNRYISWPGQANAYMLGMLEFRRLRAEAEARLGQRFDLRAFHDRVLGNGSITLPMLQDSVAAWIEEQEKGPEKGSDPIFD